MVIGGSGTVGSSVVKELFKIGPRRLHVINLGENSTVELVRDIRSSLGYVTDDFRTFVFDVSSDTLGFFLKNEGPYDYVLNFSAMKHVRSESDAYSLMRMVDVNVVATIRVLEQLVATGTKRYFAASTARAVHPKTMMGATKRLMELALVAFSEDVEAVTARLPNVAFSTGSFLASLDAKLENGSPIAIPTSSRYFITSEEAARLCLLTTLLCENRTVTFPNLERVPKVSFPEIVERYLRSNGLEMHICQSEGEAKALASELIEHGRWPCYYYDPGPADEEPDVFTYPYEKVQLERFSDLGVADIGIPPREARERVEGFVSSIMNIRKRSWTREELADLIRGSVREFVVS